MKHLFLSGTARSGTNLITRMLMASPAVEASVHGLLPLYRHFRNSVATQAGLGGKIAPDTSLHSYYGDASQRELLTEILRYDPASAQPAEDMDKVVADVRARMEYECKDLLPGAGRLSGSESYAQLFTRYAGLVEDHRGTDATQYIGLLDVWAVEFFPALSRIFEDTRFIIILRDPRGTVMSNEKLSDTSYYGNPLSYLRHWCKYAACIHHFKSHADLAERLLVVRYEDVVDAPEESARRMSDFLGLEYDPAMLDVNNFYDQSAGKTWTTNSSFEQTRTIDASFASRWKSVIPADLLQLSEFVCETDMKAFGYALTGNFDAQAAAPEVAAYLDRTNDNYYNWRCDTKNAAAEVAFDLGKRKLLGTSPSPEQMQHSFLFPEAYAAARSADG